MIVCAVIDDEPMAVDVITSHIEKVPFLRLAAQFTDALKAIEWLQGNKVDILFLDIDMPDISGLELLRSLSQAPKVIFTTAHPNYALESYDFNSIDYLLKPITFARFLKSANKAKQLLESNTNLSSSTTSVAPQADALPVLLLKSGTSTYRIPSQEVRYIEGTGNYLTLFTENDKIMVLQTMKQMQEQLSPKGFMRIHKSYIVAKQHIKKIEKASVEVMDKEIPIGSTYREAFAQWITE